jgi:hypothetical protein
LASAKYLLKSLKRETQTHKQLKFVFANLWAFMVYAKTAKIVASKTYELTETIVYLFHVAG